MRGFSPTIQSLESHRLLIGVPVLLRLLGGLAMKRAAHGWIGTRLTAIIVAVVGAAPALAGSHPMGTMPCNSNPAFVVASVRPPLPGQTPSTRRSKLRVPEIILSCDTTNVTGGYITNGFVTMGATFPTGSDCSALTPAGQITFRSSHVKARWLGIDGVPVGFSRAAVATATVLNNGQYVLDVVTTPMTGSAFTGEVMHLMLTIANTPDLAAQCALPTGLSTVEFFPTSVRIAASPSGAFLDAEEKL
jgi:hypothetical protein